MKKIIFLFLGACLLLAGCGQKVPAAPAVNPASSPAAQQSANVATSAPSVSVPGAPQAGLANPASVNCQTKGGQLQIKTRPDGGQYGICYFEDNRQCEEWALFRGECPVGGLKITGYDNDAQIYCAITGGHVDMSKKTCTTKTATCDLDKYYVGTCQ